MSVSRPASSGDGQALPGAASWARWYALVLGALAVEVVLFFLFTRAFS